MRLRRVAEVSFPTHWADFRLLGFEGTKLSEGTDGLTESAVVLVLGDVQKSCPLVRIHSQCTTGDVFHSLRCDCHDQLHLALRLIAEEGVGILIYEQQEGRGIGLMEKLRAYELQDDGLDTIQANLELGHAVDLRDYQLPVEILRLLSIASVRLITNNPEKIKAVSEAGIHIAERISADVPASPFSIHYLTTKSTKLGHLFGKIDPVGSPTPSSSDGQAL